MTVAIAHSLVSRALQVTKFQAGSNGEDGEGQVYQLQQWAAVVVFVTICVYMAMLSVVSRLTIHSNLKVSNANYNHQISYTYGDVVGTLTMIETPTATAFRTEYNQSDEVDAPLLSQDHKSEKAHVVESDLFLVKQKPITSKMRSTIKHLRAQAGPLARFRGLHVAIIYRLLHGSIIGFFSANVVSHPLVRPFVAILASIALCRIQMTWTHIVISQPSSKSWIRRIPSRAAVKNILVPTTVLAIAEQAAVCVPSGLFLLANQAFNEEMNESVGRAQNIALLQMFFIVLIAIGIVVLVVIPADVTLKRVQASMLPEEDESIVPFDRTFAGKVKPEILGGSGAVSMLDAWKSFDRSARIRLMKLYLKIFLVSIFTTIIFSMLIVGELKLAMGDNFNEAVGKAHASLQQAKNGLPMF